MVYEANNASESARKDLHPLPPYFQGQISQFKSMKVAKKMALRTCLRRKLILPMLSTLPFPPTEINRYRLDNGCGIISSPVHLNLQTPTLINYVRKAIGPYLHPLMRPRQRFTYGSLSLTIGGKKWNKISIEASHWV